MLEAAAQVLLQLMRLDAPHAVRTSAWNTEILQRCALGPALLLRRQAFHSEPRERGWTWWAHTGRWKRPCLDIHPQMRPKVGGKIDIIWVYQVLIQRGLGPLGELWRLLGSGTALRRPVPEKAPQQLD